MRHDELSRLCERGAAAEVIRWARGVLAEAAGGGVPSVLHPLGFLCLPVERSTGTGVCLHLWSPELPAPPATTSPWHCHSWDLVSLLLYGRLSNVIATLSDSGAPRPPGAEEAELRVFRVLSGAGGDELIATPRTVRAVLSDGGTYTDGALYRLPAGVFHRTVVTGETATVALGSDRAGGHDLSLGAPDLGTHRVRRRRGDPRQTARLARRAADLLANGAHT